MNLKINKMCIDDLNQIKNNLLSDFDNFWSFDIFKEELQCSSSFFIVAKKQNDEIVGFAGFKAIIDEADIMNIVVNKNYRNQGIGTFLLNNLISYAQKLKLCTITLEVNEKNLPAISLYKKFNFEKLGIRKNYYNGTDNGIIMSKKI